MTITPELIRGFRAELANASSVLIGTHLNPDGDALGSALAMSLYLDSQGISNEVLCHHPAPRNLMFLPGVKRVRQVPKKEEHDLGIMLDLDSLERLGSPEPYFSACPRLIVIDHHVPHEAPGNLRIVETSAAATAVILAQLLEAVGATITPEMATCLLTGIVTDTGSFRFRNTNPESLAVSSMLLEKGGDITQVNEEIFQSRQLCAARLLGHTLENMQLACNQQLAWCSLSLHDFQVAEATDEDTEGFVNEMLFIDSVQIAAIMREPKPGRIRCSIRSRSQYDVAEVAREFGGGGHKNAAGCTFDLSLEEAEEKVVERLKRLLGILLIRKPFGLTSHDVVNDIRRRFSTKRVGHAGTLDPMATGLLVVAVGPATRFLQYLPLEPKEYVADITFGRSTTTYDAEGETATEGPIPEDLLGAIQTHLPSFRGLIQQLPPMYSAIKVAGKPLYSYARQGHEIRRDPRTVHISAFDILESDDKSCKARIVCSGGTYIRSLAQDLGQAVGSGAHLSGLIRTRVGRFSIEQGRELNEVGIPDLISLRDALPPMPLVQLDEAQTESLREGRAIAVSAPERALTVALLEPKGNVFSVARVQGDMLQPECVIPSEVSHGPF